MRLVVPCVLDNAAPTSLTLLRSWALAHRRAPLGTQASCRACSASGGVQTIVPDDFLPFPCRLSDIDGKNVPTCQTESPPTGRHIAGSRHQLLAECSGPQDPNACTHAPGSPEVRKGVVVPKIASFPGKIDHQCCPWYMPIVSWGPSTRQPKPRQPG